MNFSRYRRSRALPGTRPARCLSGQMTWIFGVTPDVTKGNLTG